MKEVTNLRDFVEERKEMKERLSIGDMKAQMEQIEKILEQMKVDPNAYTGDHRHYDEEEDEFAIRVNVALNDLVLNYSPEQLEALKYFYFILRITDNADKTNPLLMDIEAFEDIIEPFIIHAFSKSMKNTETKLSTIAAHAQRAVEDLLISDFIYSPYKSADGKRRFVCITPELNYATEKIVKLPEKYKIETDIKLKEGGRFKSADIFIEEGVTPYIRLHLMYDGVENQDDLSLVSHLDINVSDMAEIYFNLECNTEGEDGENEYDLNAKMLTILAQQIISFLTDKMALKI